MSASTTMSLYIPHVFANITEERIATIFHKLRLGKVARVDLVAKMGHNNMTYNAAYIHFDYWYNSVAARNFQEKVLDPNAEARLVYDDPWFWVVLENKAEKHVSGDRKLRARIYEPAIYEEIETFQTPNKMLTNKDFANLMNAPTKAISATNANKFDDFDIVCRKLQFDSENYEANIMENGQPIWAIEEENMDAADDFLDELIEQMEEVEDYISEENCNLVDASYAVILEKEYNYCLRYIEMINAEVSHLRNSVNHYKKLAEKGTIVHADGNLNWI